MENQVTLKQLPKRFAKYYKGSLVLSNQIPKRAGYVFRRWNTRADGTGTAYQPGGEYIADVTVTLYAEWIPEDAILNLPENLTAIESKAFVGVPALAVRISSNVTSIAADAFDRDIIIISSAGSYAAQWAENQRHEFLAE